MDKYIGRLLDNRYEILEVIGTGGMAVVYKARCHRLNRLVAIKILKDDFMEDEDFRRRFHSESQAVAMLSHPNIVSVYDVSTSIMADYIVMELIEGISLKQYMEKKGVLNWKETLHFAIQIAKALEHAHSRGIVHRDIKPHNVMVLKNGSVKVTDFGIARMMSQGNTLTKEALGSVHYISPEQAKGGRVDNRSDIYSLGVVMYEMMSGRPPYDGDSPVAVAIQHINGGAPLPSTLNPNIPGGLEQIIMKSMEQDQTKRYASASEMLRDMDEFRKDPAILFDYNTPAEDLIKIHRPVTALETEQKPVEAETPVKTENTPSTDAQRAVEKQRGGYRIQNGDGYSDSKKTPSGQNGDKQKRNNAAIIAIIACCMVAIVAVVIFLVVLLSGGSSDNQHKLTVPNLVGKVYKELKASDYPDFELEFVTYEYHEEVPSGQILRQEPKAGTEAEAGTKIELYVSAGSELVSDSEPTEPDDQSQTASSEATTEPEDVTVMGDLTGMTEEKARSILMGYGLELEIHPGKVFSESEPKGIVVKTDPVAETVLAKGQKVTLTLSYGQQPKLEDCAGKKASDVEQELVDLDIGLKVEKKEEFNDQVETGCIISTYPEAGTLLSFDTTVTLVISKGSEAVKKELPVVIGKSREVAEALLEDRGFTKYKVEDRYSSDVPVGEVFERYVDEDRNAVLSEPVDVTYTIVLVVSQGPEPVERTESFTVPTEEVLLSNGWITEAGSTFTVYVIQDENVLKTFTGVGAGQTLSVTLTGIGYQEYQLCIGSIEQVYDVLKVNFDTGNG